MPEDPTQDSPAQHENRADKLDRAATMFVRRIEGIKRAEEIVMPLIGVVSKKANEEFSDLLKSDGIETKKEKTKTTYHIPIRKVGKFTEIQRRRESLDSAYFQTPRALLVALVSSFDAYIGDLLRATFYMKPELLNASNRNLAFSELVKFNSIEEAREHVIEKEIESVIRESHSKQFDWLESRFSVPLRQGLKSWPDFIELTERRNLFVHTDGLISTQYLDVCRSQQVNISGLHVGKRLSVTRDYFENAFKCLFEIGVKLCQVLWRKLAPDDLEKSDNSLVTMSFNLLMSEQYLLAQCLLEFATSTLKRHHSNLIRKIFIVNLAQSYKWQGDNETAGKIIRGEDWSDSAQSFTLAVAVLQDNYQRAEEVMRELGKEAKGVGRIGYETWPLFKEFRKSEQFLNAFREIYGEEFELESEVTPEQKERKNTEQLTSSPEGSPIPEENLSND